MSLSLKQWRRVREITQEEMAASCGVHVNTYRAWEENPGKISIDAAKLIARALDVSIDEIFFQGGSTKCRV